MAEQRGGDGSPAVARAFWAYLLVWSKVVRLAEITSALGIEPTESHDIGDANPHRPGGVYRWSRWTMHLEVEHPISPGTEGLSEALEALGDDLADRLRGLADRSCSVEVRVVQTFEGDEDVDDPGIHLTAAALRWVVRAGGLIDVDQYLWSATDDEEPSG